MLQTVPLPLISARKHIVRGQKTTRMCRQGAGNSILSRAHWISHTRNAMSSCRRDAVRSHQLQGYTSKITCRNANSIVLIRYSLSRHYSNANTEIRPLLKQRVCSGIDGFNSIQTITKITRMILISLLIQQRCLVLVDGEAEAKNQRL